MNYCEQCGTKLEPGAHFCQKCGQATSAGQAAAETPVTAPDEPKVIQIADPEPDTPRRTEKPARQQMSKKTLLRIVLIGCGVVVLGAAGWFAYSRLSAPSKESPPNTMVNTIVTEQAPIETPAGDSIASEPPKAVVTEKTKEKTEPASKTDKSSAKAKAKEKEKAKEPVKPSQQTTTPVKKAKPDPEVKAPAKTADTENLTRVIFEVGRKEDPKNKNPKNPIKLVIRKPTMIVRITTDHYNEGNGTVAAGNLSIKDHDGNVIGTFNAKGKSGTVGTPNAKWVTEPRIMLDKGTYFIWDSDMATWSKNFMGIGVVVVEGYETK